ncbi:MAG TPA: anti-sigma factor [Candidatus Binataceae bacterium]
MNCIEAKPLLQAYLDGELGLESALEIERHLEQCADCARERASLGALSAALGDPALRFAAPEALRRRVGAALAGEAAVAGATVAWGRAPQARARRPRQRWWFIGGAGIAGWAVAGAALAMLALVTLSRGPGLPRAGGDTLSGGGDGGGVVAREVLTSHLRSLMPGHLMDVVSTEQHTVKPWFNGRVDFSPPVNDFAADGFSLVGGRLDYLDGRAVAALVYRRRKHIVNVFVWPAADGSQSVVESTAHDGYNLMHWRRGGMNYWIVSDLNAQEMGEFARLLRGEASLPAPHS